MSGRITSRPIPRRPGTGALTFCADNCALVAARTPAKLMKQVNRPTGAPRVRGEPGDDTGRCLGIHLGMHLRPIQLEVYPYRWSVLDRGRGRQFGLSALIGPPAVVQ